MIVVIDTNALVPMLGTTHPFHEILRMWMRGEFALAALLPALPAIASARKS